MFCSAVSGLFLVTAINNENYKDFMEACKHFSCNERLRGFFCFGGVFLLSKGGNQGVN